jgi:hypothetical protein
VQDLGHCPNIDGIKQFEITYINTTGVWNMAPLALPPFFENYEFQSALLVTPSSDANGDFWLIAHPANHLAIPTTAVVNPANYVVAYKINGGGITARPIYSQAGTISQVNSYFYKINISPNRKLVAIGGLNGYGIFYFNALSGVLNFRDNIFPNPEYFKGLAFSPNSEHVFCLGTNYLFEGILSPIFNYNNSNVAVANIKSIFNHPSQYAPNNNEIRLAPDDRIYFTQSSVPYVYPAGSSSIASSDPLGVIHFPNSFGTNAGVVPFYATTNLSRDLPNIVQGESGLLPNDFKHYFGYGCGEVQFVNYSGGLEFAWDFGDNTLLPNGTNNGSAIPVGYMQNNEHPKHTYQNNGTYTVTCTIDGNTTVTKTVTISNFNLPLPITVSPVTSTICAGNSCIITPQGATNFTLNPGSLTGSSFTLSPTVTTIYTIISSSSCQQPNTIVINVLPALALTYTTVGNNCLTSANPVIIDIITTGSIFVNSNSIIGNTYTVTSGGIYTISAVTALGCSTSTTINFNMNTLDYDVVQGCFNYNGINNANINLITNLSSPIYNVSNSVGYTITPNVANTNIAFNLPNIYTVSAIGAGCTLTTTVLVLDCEYCPNAPANAKWLGDLNTNLTPKSTPIYSSASFTSGAVNLSNYVFVSPLNIDNALNVKSS